MEDEEGESRENQLASDELFFKRLIDDKAKLARHDNTLKSAQRNLGLVVGNTPKLLRIQQEINVGKDLLETDAGMQLIEDMQELVDGHQEALGRLRHSIEIARGRVDPERAREGATRCTGSSS